METKTTFITEEELAAAGIERRAKEACRLLRGELAEAERRQKKAEEQVRRLTEKIERVEEEKNSTTVKNQELEKINEELTRINAEYANRHFCNAKKQTTYSGKTKGSVMKFFGGQEMERRTVITIVSSEKIGYIDIGYEDLDRGEERIRI